MRDAATVTKAILSICLLSTACVPRRVAEAPDAPAEASRHSAALATITVSNATTSTLTIVVRSAVPPVRDITIGRVNAGEHARMAPLPAGEPVILIARRPNGDELRLDVKTFAIDAEWTWQIPREAEFQAPVK